MRISALKERGIAQKCRLVFAGMSTTTVSQSLFNVIESSRSSN